MNETRFVPIPKNTTAKLGEFVCVEGVIDVERRYTDMPTTTIVGIFKRENGATCIGEVDRDLEFLNGCKIRVKIEILETAKVEPEKEKVSV